MLTHAQTVCSYQALLSPHERDPGFEATVIHVDSVDTHAVRWLSWRQPDHLLRETKLENISTQRLKITILCLLSCDTIMESSPGGDSQCPLLLD